MDNKNSEIEKELRIIDMMLTAHSYIRDINSIRATAMDIILFVSSIILNVTVFLDPIIISYLGVSPDKAKFIIGLSSIAIFILSFIVLRVDWKQKSENYKMSAETISHLKIECNELRFIDDEIILKQKMRYIRENISKLPAKIPEKQFLKLKALHKRKIELSKMIDKNPGASVLFLKIVIWVKANGIVLKPCRNGEMNEDV